MMHSRQRPHFTGDEATLRYLTQAEADAWLVPDVDVSRTQFRCEQVAVIGAGTMGGGIAMSFANKGIPVKLLDVSEDAAERGLGVIHRNYQHSLNNGRISEEEFSKRLMLIETTVDRSAVSTADVIIETAFEDMRIKEDVFRWLGEHAKPEALLGSNTSYLDIDRLAVLTSRPDRVLGLHFFAPANVMRLLEIVRGRSTSPETLGAALDLAATLGKQPVVAGNSHGFIGNRMMDGYVRQATVVLLEGAPPEQIDKVLRGFGMPMGLFQLADLSGLDVGYKPPEQRDADGALEPFDRFRDRLIAADRRGQKTGAGIYDYDTGCREPIPSKLVQQMLEDTAKELNIKRREVSDEEIFERCLFSLANTGFALLEEGVAIRASDIDVVFVTGYGFPSVKGGPMYWAENEIGFATLRQRIEALAKRFDPEDWVPAPLLKHLASEDGTLFST